MSDQNLDIIIRTQLEAAGFEATKQQIAEVKSAMEASGGMNLEALRGFSDGVEAHVKALLKRKEAVIDGAIGAKMQADAAQAEKALQQEIKALDAFEKKKQKEIEAFQATEKKRATEQATAKDEAARSKVLEELKNNQVAETKETEKATGAKKLLRDALQAGGTEFASFAQIARAALSPIGALGLGVTFLISRLRDMAAERFAIAEFNVELEKVRTNAIGMTEMAEQAEKTATQIKKAFGEMKSAVDGYRQSLAAAAKEREAIVGTNKESDDLIAQRQIADIDASNDTESNKELRKRRVRQDQQKREAQGAIAEMGKQAAADRAGAVGARERAMGPEAAAEALDPVIKDAADALGQARAGLATEQKLQQRVRPSMEKKLAEYNVMGMEGTLTPEKKARRDQLEITLKEMDQGLADMTDVVTAAAEVLKGYKERKKALEDEAKGFRETGIQLDKSATGKEAQQRQMQERFNVVQPQREGVNALENSTRFNQQFSQEEKQRMQQEAKQKAEAEGALREAARAQGDFSQTTIEVMTGMAEELRAARAQIAALDGKLRDGQT